MATLAVQPESITEQFGPHLSKSTGMRLDSGVVPDKVVKTHCCFCGQQCGIQLLVKNDQVIGFEPWYEFPFNQGKLCPKGVKRYLQGAHPDRLLHAYRREPGNAHGFSPIPYEEAIRKVAARDRSPPEEVRPVGICQSERSESHQREVLFNGKICSRVPKDAFYGLQWPALHGERRRRK